ncbi:uncharacterized protein [Diabrotica undecimpunctata]|uniref:uncharacterized protein n=1 Tax=Diabrotica undecimpunctata TaxID=50387 RepID=UPI003B63EF6C
MLFSKVSKFIALKRYDTVNTRTARPIDLIELKALFGLLYISGANKSNHQNADDLFRTDGRSMEIYLLKMSLKRFQFILRYIWFDDESTRIQRQEFDKLAAIREIVEAFNSNLPKYYNLSAYTTIDEKLKAFRGKCSFRIYIPNKPNHYGI